MIPPEKEREIIRLLNDYFDKQIGGGIKKSFFKSAFSGEIKNLPSIVREQTVQDLVDLVQFAISKGWF